MQYFKKKKKGYSGSATRKGFLHGDGSISNIKFLPQRRRKLPLCKFNLSSHRLAVSQKSRNVCPEHIQRKYLIRSTKPPQLGPFPHERGLFSPPGYPDVPSLSPRMSLGALPAKPLPNMDHSLGRRCVSTVRPSVSSHHGRNRNLFIY